MTTTLDPVPPVVALPEQPYVRLPKAAELLDISEDTLDRAIRPGLVSGEIVSYKFGRVRTISWHSLITYLDRYFAGGIQPKRGAR